MDKLHPPEQLQELMASSDYVVCATPYTPATHGLVNAAAIAAMQPHAVFVNVGRGKCVDQAALVQGVSGMALYLYRSCVAVWCQCAAAVDAVADAAAVALLLHPTDLSSP